jgi:hypothetical protein
VAAAIKQALGRDTILEVGGSGEFTVWVGATLVAEKKFMTFPAPDAVVAAVRAALAG